MSDIKVFTGHALEQLSNLPRESVDCVITSPPYYQQRDYGPETVFIWDGEPDCEHIWDEPSKNAGVFCRKCMAWKGQLGQEPDPDLYVKHLTAVFSKIYLVLKSDGNLFIIIGDTYAKSVNQVKFKKTKQLLLIPYRLAIELQREGWIIRDLIIWTKKVFDLYTFSQVGNALPESARDRLTRVYEIIIHAVKSPKYYFKKPTTRPLSYPNLCIDSKSLFQNYIGFKSSEIVIKAIKDFKDSKYIKESSVNIGKSLAGRTVKRVISKYTNKEEIGKIFKVNIYLKQKLKEKNLTIKELSRQTDISANTLVHFFRLDFSGVALPSKEVWDILKPILELDDYEKFVTPEIRKLLPVLGPSPYVCNVIKCNTKPSKEHHFAIMPLALVEFLIEIACPPYGVVLDPFGGIGTTAIAALKKNRKAIIIEANSAYVEILKKNYNLTV